MSAPSGCGRTHGIFAAYCCERADNIGYLAAQQNDGEVDVANILVLNGPNLNLLGKREPGRYGAESLTELQARLDGRAAELGHSLTWLQSNAEHELVDAVQSAAGKYTFIIINAAAYTHTSIALRDALLAVAIPFIEVHVSNVHARENFRRHSYLSDIATGVITGLGTDGYEFALAAADRILKH